MSGRGDGGGRGPVPATGFPLRPSTASGLPSGADPVREAPDFAEWQRDWPAENGLGSEVLCASTFLLPEFHAPYQVVWYGLVL